MSEQLPQWPVNNCVIDVESLLSEPDETEFLRLSFEMLKEATSLVSIAFGVRPVSDPIGWGRNDAILVGHLARMARLMRSIVRQVADGHGGDLQIAVQRQFLESASTTIYLIEDDGSGERYDSYVFDSLIPERELLAEIETNVEKRGGDVLPIEVRMRASIADTLAAAGVSLEDVPSRRANKWPSAQTRVELLGTAAYKSYRTSSGAIHGSFTDVEKHYLVRIGDRFDVELDALPFRPQTLTSLARLALYVVSRFASAKNPMVNTVYAKAISDFSDAVARLDDLHERFLTSRRWTE